jgi:hypothetical protein
LTHEIDVCIVCGIEIIKTTSRQVTCLNKKCQRIWKSGVTPKKPKKVYKCLRCGEDNTTGYTCKKCRKANSKIQEWEIW